MKCVKCLTKIKKATNSCYACGTEIHPMLMPKPKKGMGIASMAIGILATYWALMDLIFALMPYITELSFFRWFATDITAIVITVFVGLIGLILGVVERFKNPNGFNLTGIILAGCCFAISAVALIIIL